MGDGAEEASPAGTAAPDAAAEREEQAGPDASTRSASGGDAGTSADDQERSGESVPVNQWVAVEADEADELTPVDLLLPTEVPEGFSDDFSIALRMWDLTGDGQGDLHSVLITITPEGGPRDQSGHGNVQINIGPAPEQLPPTLAEQPTIDVGRGIEARGASDGQASAAAWVEDDLLVQLSGELDEAALRELVSGMR